MRAPAKKAAESAASRADAHPAAEAPVEAAIELPKDEQKRRDEAVDLSLREALRPDHRVAHVLQLDAGPTVPWPAPRALDRVEPRRGPRDAQARDARLVLVITGKGRGAEPGVLRRQVPQWLNLPEFRALVVGFEALGVGLGTAAYVAYVARTTNPAYTATQLALFTSLEAMPRTFMNATTGWLVQSLGWTQFFLVCTVLAVPGMLLLFKVAPWTEKAPAQGGGGPILGDA